MAKLTSKSSKPEATTRTRSSRHLRAQQQHQNAAAVSQAFTHAPDTTTATATATTTASHVATANEQQQTVEQSVKMMQQVIFGCVSNLASARSMFRLDCFEPMDYHFEFPENGDEGLQPGGKAKFVGLKRGISSKLDALLELLDTGIADALEKGFLGSLHFTIYEHKGHPEEALEQWNLQFIYANNKQTGTRVPSGVQITERCRFGEPITVGQAKQSLIKFIQKVTNISYTLPELPDARYMSVEILYNEDCPADYHAPNFSEPVLGASRFPHSEDWKEVNLPVASMATNHHEVALSVIHLSSCKSDGGNKLPSGLACTKEVSKEESVRLTERLLGHSSRGINEESETQAPTELPKRTSSSRVQKTTGDKTYVLSPPSVNGSLQHPGDQASIPAFGEKQRPQRSTSDKQTKRQLQGMLRTTKNSSTLEQTQVIAESSIPTISAAESSAATSSAAEPLNDSPLIFSRARVERLQAKKDKISSPQTRKPKIVEECSSQEASLSIRCECNHDAVEGGMILCHVCDQYQHLNCYGYLGTTDSRIADKHVCYTCLLDNEPRYLKEATDLVLHRRACLLLRNSTFDGSSQLTEDLGCTPYFTGLLLRELRNNGMMSPSPIKRASKAQLAMIVSDAANKQMLRLYFDPRKGINQFVESPSATNVEKATSGSQGMKRPAEASNDMEPPQPKKLFGDRSIRELDLYNTVTPRAARRTT